MILNWLANGKNAYLLTSSTDFGFRLIVKAIFEIALYKLYRKIK